MGNNIKLTQDAAPQPEKSSSYAHPRVQKAIRGELVQITRRITMLQEELEQATTQRDNFQRWLDAHAEGER